MKRNFLCKSGLAIARNLVSQCFHLKSLNLAIIYYKIIFLQTLEIWNNRTKILADRYIRDFLGHPFRRSLSIIVKTNRRNPRGNINEI